MNIKYINANIIDILNIKWLNPECSKLYNVNTNTYTIKDNIIVINTFVDNAHFNYLKKDANNFNLTPFSFNSFFLILLYIILCIIVNNNHKNINVKWITNINPKLTIKWV